MRLEELRLIAYGPFTERTLKLQPGLNVLHGPNEAGKSSTLRAVHALLFGVEERTSDNFVHSYQQLRVGGVLVDSQGRRLECVRRKGRQSTLRDGDDNEPIDEGELGAMLGSVDKEFFTSFFGIDHRRLREGGEEVVRGEGRVGEILFSAGGVSHLREKQETLQNAAADLFKPTGRNPRINAAISEAKSLGNQVRELQQSPEQWARCDADHRRLKEKEQILRKRLVEAESTETRLKRILAAKEFVGAWQDKRAQLAELAGVVTLADDAEQRFRDETEKRTRAATAKEAANKRVAELQSALDKTEVPALLLSEEARIDELYRRLGSHEKAMEDRGVLAGQQRAARNAAKRMIEKLGWDVSVDDAKEHRVADEKKARVRALSSRHGEVTLGKSRQQQTLGHAETNLDDLKRELANADKPADPVALRAAASSVAAVLDLEDGLAAQRERAKRLNHEAEGALARLEHFSGSIDEACRLEVPGEATVDEFEQRRLNLAKTADVLSKQAEANQSEREGIAQQLQAFELQESVPTEEELVAARATRDRGVRLALGALVGEKPDANVEAAFVSEVGEGSDLATAVDSSVRQADGVADRLRRESSRVAEKSQLVARLESLDAKASQLQAKQEQIREQQADWDRDWRQRWRASGVVPASPAEMRGWLRELTALIELSGRLASASDELQKNENRVETAALSLGGALQQQNVSVSDCETLAQLVEITESHIKEAEEKRLRYSSLEADIARVTREAEEAKQDLKAAEGELSQWRKDWADAVAPLSLDADALPDQAEAVLANLDELFRSLDEAAGYRARIWGIDKTAAEFAEAAKEMSKRAAPDLVDLSVDELMASLNQRLDAAKQVRQRAESLEEQLKSELEAVSEAERSLADSTAILKAMVAEAACNGVDNLRPAIEASRKKKSLQDDIDERERQLTPLCGGKPLLEFAAEVEQEDADRLPTQCQEIKEVIADLRDELEETIAALQRTASELDKYDGSAEAADKAEERQSLIARIEEDVREYVIASAASRLLRLAVERYQQKSQGPVLASASEHFRRLTGGSFETLQADYDESGQEVLVGGRPGGRQLAVEDMSEGTRDQLYLALRLGTLDYWFDNHESIPFIVDDILLTFDDHRATAALQTLAAIAERSQVLVFTHHEHIVSIIRNSALPISPRLLRCEMRLDCLVLGARKYPAGN